MKDFKLKQETLSQAEKAKFAKAQMDLGEMDLKIKNLQKEIEKLQQEKNSIQAEKDKCMRDVN